MVKDLRSDERDGVREEGLEECQDVLPRGDVVKLLKGHEEGAGERPVLRQKISTVGRAGALLPLLPWCPHGLCVCVCVWGGGGETGCDHHAPPSCCLKGQKKGENWESATEAPPYVT